MNKREFIKEELKKEYGSNLKIMPSDTSLDQHFEGVSYSDSEDLGICFFDPDSNLVFFLEDPKREAISIGRNYFRAKFELGLLYPLGAIYDSDVSFIDDMEGVDLCLNMKENTLIIKYSINDVDICSLKEALAKNIEKYEGRPKEEELNVEFKPQLTEDPIECKKDESPCQGPIYNSLFKI